MTPAEKAKELVGEFKDAVNESDFHVPEFITNVPQDSFEYLAVLEEETNSLAKQCAIKAVNLLIENDQVWYDDAGVENQSEWIKVKAELEKL